MSSTPEKPTKLEFVPKPEVLRLIARSSELVPELAAKMYIYLARLAQEHDEGEGCVVVATWVKRRNDETYTCTIENARLLRGIISGYLAGDNHQLQFWVANYTVANRIRLEWARLTQGVNAYQRLFL